MNNELVPQPSWWKRNWKWVVPVGGCLTLIILFIVFVGSIFYGVTTFLEKSEPYEYAMQKINNDEEITAILGSPIAQDGIMQGNLNWHNGDGQADFKIPVSGSKRSGVLYVNATSVGDAWTYHEINLVVKDQEEINLLQKPKPEE